MMTSTLNWRNNWLIGPFKYKALSEWWFKMKNFMYINTIKKLIHKKSSGAREKGIFLLSMELIKLLMRICGEQPLQRNTMRKLSQSLLKSTCLKSKLIITLIIFNMVGPIVKDLPLILPQILLKQLWQFMALSFKVF